MDLIYLLIYNRYANFFLRWVNKALSPLLPDSVKIPPSGTITVDTGQTGFKLSTNQTSYLTQRLFWHGMSSFEYSTLFTVLIKKVDTFVDAGANIGYYSLLACAENRNIRVFSFEPAEGAFTYLGKNVALNRMNDRITAEKLALGDSGGELTFQEIENDKYRFTSHVLSGESHASTKVTPRKTRSYRVEATTLDAYCDRHQVGAVDLIKIDTEGSESSILTGAEGVISRHRPVIICEILFDFREKQIESILKRHGYEFYFFRDQALVKKDTIIRSADDGVRDCFFVHPDNSFMIEEFIQKR